ncbi:MAG: hypothetical protein KDE23_17555, partial [Caldilinea sp.]|nr:hypothetical protein [Caldilinea sp.]
LAEMTSMSERKVRDCLDRLQDINLVDKAPNFRPDGGQTSNTYILYPVAPPAQDAATPLHVVQPPPARGAAKQDSEEQEDGDAPAVPFVAFPEPADDPDRDAALDAVQMLGLFNATDLERFNDLWPELVGRRDWIGRAVTVTRDAQPRAPIPYLLKVLANAIHTNQPPGNQPPKRNGRSQGHDLDALLGITP